MSSQIAVVYTRVRLGLTAESVAVEAHISNGLPSLNIVGLPDGSVKESKDRVRSALLSCGFEVPIKKILINLAPADLPKTSSHFDLPIALAILAASNQIPKHKLTKHEFMGELALSGRLHAVKDAFLFAYYLQQAEKILVLPEGNSKDVLGNGHGIYIAKDLKAVVAYLRNGEKLSNCVGMQLQIINPQTEPRLALPAYAVRALTLGASGRHHLLLWGAPGSGRKNFAHNLLNFLPELKQEELIEIAAIHSLRQTRVEKITTTRPFRSPHSSITFNSMHMGPKLSPGEISLAHKGVLLLHEINNFFPKVLLSLLRPMDEGVNAIYKYGNNLVFPAQFWLVATMMPCPCGYAWSKTTPCMCKMEKIKQYLARLNLQVLERIDLHIKLVPMQEVISQVIDISAVRQHCTDAWEMQYARAGKLNGELLIEELDTYCTLTKNATITLQRAERKYNLTPIVKQRILVLSRTIADLEKCDNIAKDHILEALHYRADFVNK